MTEPSTKDLLPCPFCGGEVTIDTMQSPQIESVAAQAECGECGTRGRLFQALDFQDAVDAAIAAWNRRAHDGEDDG